MSVFKTIVKIICNPISEQVLSYPCALLKGLMVSRLIKEYETAEFSIGSFTAIDLEGVYQDLREHNNKAKQLKDSIEEKAKASLFTVSITITLIVGIVGFIKGGQRNIVPESSWLILAGAVLYLLMAGISSIQAYNIRKFYEETLKDKIQELDKKKNNNVSQMNLELNRASFDKENGIREFYRYVRVNGLRNTVRANYVYSTYICIRNGIILVAVFFFLFAKQSVSESSAKPIGQPGATISVIPLEGSLVEKRDSLGESHDGTDKTIPEPKVNNHSDTSTAVHLK